MNTRRNTEAVRHRMLGAGLTLALLAGCAVPPTTTKADDGHPLQTTAKVDTSITARALQQLPPKPREQRPAVAIHRFRSSVPEVNGSSATDMFTAALVSSGQFRVLERAQLRGGVVAEKQLNASGQTQGSTAQVQLLDAKYMFEGTVSEANTDESATQGNLSVGPVGVAGNSSRSSVVIDVRVVAVATGEVVDAITVRKPIYNRGAGVSVGGGAAMAAGSSSAFAAVPDAAIPTTRVGGGVSTARKDGVGRALRACIEVAVLQLAQRANLELEGPNAAPVKEAAP